MQIKSIPQFVSNYLAEPMLLHPSAAYSLMSDGPPVAGPSPSLGTLPLNVRVIPIAGYLTSRKWPGEHWDVSYDEIRAAVLAAGDDASVDHVVLDMDTPGGGAALIETAGQAIAEVADKKKVTVLVRSMALSGGMWLAVHASEIVALESAQVGSIGAVLAHLSFEGMLGNMGIKATMIQGGAQKTLGSAYSDLTPEDRAALQARISKLHDNFASVVATQRGLSVEAVKGTEAAVFTASEALALGLVDRVTTLSAFLDELTVEDTEPMEIKTAADLQAAYPDLCKEISGVAAIDAPTIAQAAKAERERVAAITTSESAEGRSKLATHLAFNTEMSAEDATAILAASAPEQIAQPAVEDKGLGLAEMMAKIKNPPVGLNKPETAELSEEEELNAWIDGIHKL